MSIPNGQHTWPLPSVNHASGGRMHHVVDDGLAQTQILVDNANTSVHEPSDIEDENRRAYMADYFRRSEARVAAMFLEDGSYDYRAIEAMKRPATISSPLPAAATDHSLVQEPPRKKVKRIIDEEDYEDDEDEEEVDAPRASPPKYHNAAAAAAKSLLSPSKSGSSPVQSVPSPGKHGDRSKEHGKRAQAKTSEDARKELEEARNATEEVAKRTFHTLFYTLENDKVAMHEQQQLEESEKQLQAEMDKTTHNGTSQGPGQNHGSLSNANLGTSSLTLKHLIARIDMKRAQVYASDAELRLLMNEVRKNRSKWASEENVGQEELYEALDKVLSELKAHTEYSTPFLNRVNKRDAPDYYNLIKQPMDLGSMTKKLKALQYKSKADFVADLNLIWDNCLRYNQDMGHPLRRMANGMRREAEKLIVLIPEIVIRSRAEVEAEERRKQNGGEDDGGDDSDDEPIMSSRGRKAGTKGAAKSRKALSDPKEGTPGIDQKPVLQLNGLLAKPHQEGSEVDGSAGIGTPPIGSITPSGINGQAGSNADGMDIDGPSLDGITLGQALGEADQAFEDEEYKIWKQVTKKERALLAKERAQLFNGNKLNVEEPALLRTKAGMRRFLKSRREAEAMGILHPQGDTSIASAGEDAKSSETLAEGMEDDVDRPVPDYYEPQTVVPDIAPKLQWIEDGEGQVINQHEEFLRLVPKGHFLAPASRLTSKIDANMRQMQETRKLCSKISVIKQMQIQSQVYTNQFPKYNPEPFSEADIEPHYLSGDGPVMAPAVCRSAMQRTVAKIFYHAGFEELQPSALDAVTDIAGDYFQKIVRTFNVYREAEKQEATGVWAERAARWKNRFTPEEVVLHTLNEHGCDIEGLEAYARDDLDRLGTKLGQIHERMKFHLAELLRPALTDGGPDGSGAFKDGSEQFTTGDFAEELGEDFFGFKSLGLDKEFGMEMMSVPLHLLQTRVRTQYQMMQTSTAGVPTVDLFDSLPAVEPVTKENIEGQIGLVKNFFLAKLHANGDQPLVEDEDLPVKQRRPRPRLGATGKIVSPQKRPPKEQIAMAKKRKRLESQVGDGKVASTSSEKGTPAKRIKSVALNGPTSAPGHAPPVERRGSIQSQTAASQTDKDDIGMMSPESLEQR